MHLIYNILVFNMRRYLLIFYSVLYILFCNPRVCVIHVSLRHIECVISLTFTKVTFKNLYFNINIINKYFNKW